MAIILEGKFKFPALCKNAEKQEPDAPLLSCDAPSEGPGGCALDPSLISWVGTWRYANRQSRTSFQYVYWGPAEQAPTDATSSTQEQQRQQQEERPATKLEPIMEVDTDTAAESSTPNESATASTVDAVVVTAPAVAAAQETLIASAEPAVATPAVAAVEAPVAAAAAAAAAAAEDVKPEAAAAAAVAAEQRPNLTVDVTFAHIEAEAAEDEFMRGMPSPTPLAAEGSKPPAFDMAVYGIGADAQPPWGRWQGSFVVKNRGAKADQIVRESFELQQGEQGYSIQGAPAATPGAVPVRGVGRNLYGKFTLTGEYVAATGACTLTRLYYSVQSAPTPRTQTPSAAGRKRKRPAPSSAATPRSDLASPLESFSDQSIAERRPRRLRAPSVHTVGGAELEEDSCGEEPVRKQQRVYRPKRQRSNEDCYGDDSAELDAASAADDALLAQGSSLDPAASAAQQQQVAERTRATTAARTAAAEAQDPTEEVWRAAFLDDATGEVYEGGWHKGRRASLGACVFPNGNMYEGEWRRGREHGHGALMTGTRRVIYSGDWVDGKLCGRGTYNFPGGAVYTGDWRDNMRHGKGVYTLPTG
jgi:hypothetical protein